MKLRVRMFLTAILTAAFLLVVPSFALADPEFGPGAGNGQGNNAPQDTGARCHPPGQTSDLPQCG